LGGAWAKAVRMGYIASLEDVFAVSRHLHLVMPPEFEKEALRGFLLGCLGGARLGRGVGQDHGPIFGRTWAMLGPSLLILGQS